MDDALHDLGAALACGALSVLYQPQVTADGRSMAAVEALVRWCHPKAGWISPSDFVAYAEKTGLIHELGEFVLCRTCHDARNWPSLSVAVNVSPLQFGDPDFTVTVDQAIARSGLAAKRLELEITEGAIFSDPESASRLMHQLRERGVKLALDDFGTGYASLSYLRLLPWDKVKIDKSFIDDVTSVTSAAIVHSIVALARAIGLKITAEGVETEDQQRFLRLAGCHFLQGYRFSQPVEANVIGEMIRNGFPAYAGVAA